MITRQTISELQKEAKPLKLELAIFGLKMDREAHRQAIAIRVEKMLEKGLVKEVQSLLDHGPTPKHQAYRTIGIPETEAFLKNDITYKELKKMLTSNTWSLAKRQMAWFKRDLNITWIDVTGKLPGQVATCIQSALEEK